jgi:hypothetical protein
METMFVKKFSRLLVSACRPECSQKYWLLVPFQEFREIFMDPVCWVHSCHFCKAQTKYILQMWLYGTEKNVTGCINTRHSQHDQMSVWNYHSATIHWHAHYGWLSCTQAKALMDVVHCRLFGRKYHTSRHRSIWMLFAKEESWKAVGSLPKPSFQALGTCGRTCLGITRR